LGAAALDYMAGRAMGVRAFVSLGNRADVAEDELLRYFRDDEWTRVILLYIEGIRNGRAFLEAASSVTPVKPIVALKVGRSSSGARAAASHTAAMAGQDEVYDSAFELSGIVRARNLDEFFDMGRALLYQPPAKGDRVAILTNAGGPGVMAADACEESGLSVVELSEETSLILERLKAEGKILPYASIRNPVDLSGTATSEMFETALRVLIDDEGIDGILVITLHHTPAILDDVVGRIVHASYEKHKPVVACDIGSTEMAEEIRSRFEKLRVPAYISPERAARALYALVTYGKHLERLKRRGLAKASSRAL
jgi:acyl-CoA synthetase (NDP forming)